LPLVLALSLRGRSGDTVLSYMLWVILKKLQSYHLAGHKMRPIAVDVVWPVCVCVSLCWTQA